MSSFESHWSRQELDGWQLDVFEPRQPAAGVVIWLHGYDGASFRGREAFEAAFAQQNLRAICPHTGPWWWLDQSPPDHPDFNPMQFVRRELVEWIARQYGVQPPQIGLTGVGMGGQAAVNLAFRAARQFRVVAAISPDLDFHQWHGRGTPLDAMFPSQEAARQQTAILHLHPLNWPAHLLLVCDPHDAACFEGTERLASKLASTGIPFEADFETTAGGHTWDYFERMAPVAAKFLAERLRQQANPPISPS